jgi:hypothetical protein
MTEQLVKSEADVHFFVLAVLSLGSEVLWKKEPAKHGKKE